MYGEHRDKRSDYSGFFFEYLLSACWKKLYRRFSSWQGLSFIRCFEKQISIFEGHFDLIGKMGGPEETCWVQGPGDRTLVQFLYYHKDIFEIMLPYALDRHPWSQSSISISVFDKLREAIDKSHNGDLMLYTKDTALGFHYLVYFSLLIAGQAIRAIKDRQLDPRVKLTAKNKASVEAFLSSIGAAVVPMKLLQYVLNSTAFKQHIKVWTNNGDSVEALLPKWSEKQDNLLFGKAVQILATLKKGPSKESQTEGGDKVGVIPKETQESRSKDGKDDSDDDGDAPEVCKSIC
jgi:hypothetical protein